MENKKYTIWANRLLASSIYEMTLQGNTSFITAPGQFINIQLDGFYLRRPISLCSWEEDQFTIIYKVVGKGTRFMSTLSAGTELDILTGLGNGFQLEAARDRQSVVIGGGVGVPPMYGLARTMVKAGMKPQVVLGFNTKEESFYIERFRELGLEVTVTTADGSLGIKGFVTDGLCSIDYDYYFCCGPKPMLKAVYNRTNSRGQRFSGQLSFEEHMGCGFGACMGCSCHTLTGSKRVCVDGPVFKSEEVQL